MEVFLIFQTWWQRALTFGTEFLFVLLLILEWEAFGGLSDFHNCSLIQALLVMGKLVIILRGLGGAGPLRGAFCILDDTLWRLRLIFAFWPACRLCSGLWSRGMMLASGDVPATQGQPM